MGKAFAGGLRMDARTIARWLAWTARDRLTYPSLLLRARRESAEAAGDLIEHRIAWGDDPAQHALLILPREGMRGDRVVAFVHGGSWRRGSPADYRFVGRALARAGYATALLGYRLVPEHTFPAQRDDVLAGLRAVLAESQQVGLPGGGAVLAGHSAGAHLAALAAYDGDSRERHGVGDGAVAGLLAVSGPLDIGLICENAPCPLFESLMGRPEGWDEADPILFVSGDASLDVLAVHGRRDPMVSVAASESFVARVNGQASRGMPDAQHGDGAGRARLLVAENGYHGDLVKAIAGQSAETPETYAWLADVAGA